jgi:type IV pilus assembly protein PilY1
MTTTRFRHAFLVLVLLLQALACGAEDIEAFMNFTQADPRIRPNLVFVFDTSGSMDTRDVPGPSQPYDATTTYSGSCTTDSVYWSNTGSPPACSGSQFVDGDKNHCAAAAGALGTTAGSAGFYTGRVAQLNGKTWGGIVSGKNALLLECAADAGTHGNNASPTSTPWSANVKGGWQSGQTGSVDWGATGGAYTLYRGNYLNWRNSQQQVYVSRMAAVKEVFASLTQSLSNVNLAVMRYSENPLNSSNNRGGYFVMPMQQLLPENRADYVAAVNAFIPRGNTPLTETLFEAYRFFQGGAVMFGNRSVPGTNVPGVLILDNSQRYKSPVEFPCQKNFVVFLTDGEPTNDFDADSAIRSLPNFAAATGSATCTGNCMDELSRYMHTQDCSSTHADTQKVGLYTIGFTTGNISLLSQAAQKGGGRFYTANSAAELTDVFNSIMADIFAINTTFVAPTVAVNAFNRMTHADSLFFALFKPTQTPRWPGNVKHFKLRNGLITDASGKNAIDPVTAFFAPDAQSFWTDAANAPDGADVLRGGAASKLGLTRRLYTFTGESSPVKASLNDDAHRLHETNARVTKAMLGDASMSDARRTSVLQWARGVDVLDENGDADITDPRRIMGAPLHTRPALITYGSVNGVADNTLYIGTNGGFLTALDATTGEEQFSFMPRELLPSLQQQHDNAAGRTIIHGMDGPLSAWVQDRNNNFNLNEAGDSVLLFQGMRRGGRNYYALDVSRRNAPLLQWVIKGGEAGPFAELGQTWSSPVRTRIKLNGAQKDVLVFGGGYDPQQDERAQRVPDAMGRSLFIVDAYTGALLWQAGPAGAANGDNPPLLLPAMQYSLPSDPAILDLDGDGFMDRLYIGDTGGQVWRVDFASTNTGAATLATGGVFASLGGATTDSYRRFFYPPDISLGPRKRYLNIALGSGHREKPLGTTVHDGFFVLRDSAVYGPARDADGKAFYPAMTLADLHDATSNLVAEGSEEQMASALSELTARSGWYLWLNDVTSGAFVGEKVLERPLTFAGQILFTTYTPSSNQSASCAPEQGVGRAYVLNASDGTPVIDRNPDHDGTDLSRIDRSQMLRKGGLPPGVTIFFPDTGSGDPSASRPGDPLVFVGTERIDTRIASRSPVRTYWRTE